MGYNEPLDAEYDSRNPALQPDFKMCPFCDGEGYYTENIWGETRSVICEECEGSGIKTELENYEKYSAY